MRYKSRRERRTDMRMFVELKPFVGDTLCVKAKFINCFYADYLSREFFFFFLIVRFSNTFYSSVSQLFFTQCPVLDFRNLIPAPPPPIDFFKI